MAKYIVVLLDEGRLKKLEGSGLEKKVEKLFGGALNAFNVELSDEDAQRILDEFATARVDSRGAITDVPVAFNRVVFEEIAKTKSLGSEVMQGVFARLAEIKEMAAKESEYLPPPDIEV
ncbi:MAG: hypothetical protein AB1507_07260 [Bacillota bacterium]|jgi:hypothetical protein|nr:hypothetical protein [Thermoanaerobacteraceae bacterium]